MKRCDKQNGEERSLTHRRLTEKRPVHVGWNPTIFFFRNKNMSYNEGLKTREMFIMLRQLLYLVLEQLEGNQKKDSSIDKKIIQLIEEINELEIKHAQALADVERWGDINDKSNYRTVEYNRIGRIIEAKQKMIDTLKHRI